jgi:atypical dual specificity phosphatase
MTILGDNYRWIHGHLIRRPSNFSWVIKDKLAGSGRPMTYRQFLWLVAQGIDSIITVREGPLSSDWFINTNFAANSIEHVHLKRLWCSITRTVIQYNRFYGKTDRQRQTRSGSLCRW